MTVEIRRGADRFAEREPGRLTRHSFSFGAHYDPARLAFGPMVCHDDHVLGAGQGFDRHPHRDLEIVSWVVSGALRHTDGTGAATVVPAGSVAVLSTGDGVEHAEHATDDGGCRFVQVWLRGASGEPGYRVDAPDLAPGALVEVARPRPDSVFSVARLAAHGSVELPAAPRLHVYVATGALLRSSPAQPLGAGDAFCMTGEPAHTVTAAVPTDLLVWSFAESAETQA